MAETTTPRASDLLSVRSRVSWGAIIAGAMVALAIHFVLALLGVALGLEAVQREAGFNISAVAAIYYLIALLIAMFFGGWATSRLAVGESKLESVLYGIILWGLLFAGMVWLFASGVQLGYGAILGVASGAYAQPELGNVSVENLQRMGLDEETAKKFKSELDAARTNPVETGRFYATDPQIRHAARQASWWALLGVLVSMATVIAGSLVGSGELLQPVPILGVRRAPRTPAAPPPPSTPPTTT